MSFVPPAKVLRKIIFGVVRRLCSPSGVPNPKCPFWLLLPQKSPNWLALANSHPPLSPPPNRLPSNCHSPQCSIHAPVLNGPTVQLEGEVIPIPMFAQRAPYFIKLEPMLAQISDWDNVL